MGDAEKGLSRPMERGQPICSFAYVAVKVRASYGQKGWLARLEARGGRLWPVAGDEWMFREDRCGWTWVDHGEVRLAGDAGARRVSKGLRRRRRAKPKAVCVLKKHIF